MTQDALGRANTFERSVRDEPLHRTIFQRVEGNDGEASSAPKGRSRAFET
jgi:hypothetical protein